VSVCRWRRRRRRRKRKNNIRLLIWTRRIWENWKWQARACYVREYTHARGVREAVNPVDEIEGFSLFSLKLWFAGALESNQRDLMKNARLRAIILRRSGFVLKPGVITVVGQSYYVYCRYTVAVIVSSSVCIYLVNVSKTTSIRNVIVFPTRIIHHIHYRSLCHPSPASTSSTIHFDTFIITERKISWRTHDECAEHIFYYCCIIIAYIHYILLFLGCVYDVSLKTYIDLYCYKL